MYVIHRNDPFQIITTYANPSEYNSSRMTYAVTIPQWMLIGTSPLHREQDQPLICMPRQSECSSTEWQYKSQNVVNPGLH